MYIINKVLLVAVVVVCQILCVSAQTTADEIASLIPSGNDVYRHGYNEMDDEEKLVYDGIIKSLCHFEANMGHSNIEHRCDLTDVPSNWNIFTVRDYLRRIQHDVPEMFLLSTYIPRQSNGTFYARVGSVNNPGKYLEELQKLNDAAKSILSPITEGMSDYEKLKVIHDGFINWGDYGDMNGADAGNIRGALINKRAVCEGFARAGLYLCQKAGLKCIYVEGQLRTSTVNDTWGNHAWNFVELNGKWYLMDLTTDGGFAGVCGYSAFLRGEDYFSENYKLTYKDGSDPNTNGVYKSLPALAPKTYDPSDAIIGVECDATTSRVFPVKFLTSNGEMKIEVGKRVYNANGMRMR